MLLITTLFQLEEVAIKSICQMERENTFRLHMDHR